MIHLLVFIASLALAVVCGLVACLSWLVWTLSPERDWKPEPANPDVCRYCGYDARRHESMYP